MQKATLQRTALSRLSMARGLRLALTYVLLGFITLFMLLPLYWMLSGSLKTGTELFSIPVQWWPSSLQWVNYRAIFENYPFLLFFGNSVLIAGATAALNLLLSSMAGYSLAKFSYVGKRPIFWLVLVTLLLPLQAAVIPLYLVVRDMGLLDTRLAVILPFAATPFGIFLMRQYMMSVPTSLMEAARIDGATELRIYWSIVLPICKPVLAALGIFSFMFNWNNFLWPLVVLESESKFTMPLGIALMQSEYATAYHELMAAASFASFPVLLVYLFLQRHFINSMVLSGVKG